MFQNLFLKDKSLMFFFLSRDYRDRATEEKLGSTRYLTLRREEKGLGGSRTVKGISTRIHLIVRGQHILPSTPSLCLLCTDILAPLLSLPLLKCLRVYFQLPYYLSVLFWVDFSLVLLSFIPIPIISNLYLQPNCISFWSSDLYPIVCLVGIWNVICLKWSSDSPC